MLIKDLCDRYQLSSRKSLYSRLNALNLELAKDTQGRSYATPEQLELLDQLHQHLKDGGTLNSFTPVTPVVVTTQPPLTPTESSLSATTQHKGQLTAQPLTPEFLGELMGAIAASAAEQIASKLSVSKLSHNRELEEAFEKGWLLSTSEVRELIGVKPTTHKGEDTYKRGCWRFIKSGKIGNQAAWKVVKVDY